MCYMSKSLDELLAVSYQAQEGLDFSVSLGQSKFSHHFQVLFAGPDALLGHIMGQIVDLILEEFALTWLEFQIIFSEAHEHNVQASQVFLFSWEKTITSSK